MFCGLCVVQDSQDFQIAPRFFRYFFIFETKKFTAPFKTVKIHGTFQKLCLELAAGFFRCVAQKKRFNRKVSTQPHGTRLNRLDSTTPTDGSIGCCCCCYILALVSDFMEGTTAAMKNRE